jgi:hypothetical protein
VSVAREINDAGSPSFDQRVYVSRSRYNVAKSMQLRPVAETAALRGRFQERADSSDEALGVLPVHVVTAIRDRN